MRVGVQLLEEEMEAYRKLIDEFSNVFAWSYNELKGIARDMVEHRILLISGAKPIRQKKNEPAIAIVG